MKTVVLSRKEFRIGAVGSRPTPELRGAGRLTSGMELNRHPGILCSDLVSRHDRASTPVLLKVLDSLPQSKQFAAQVVDDRKGRATQANQPDEHPAVLPENRDHSSHQDEA
jgi:hypothetical protein